MTEMYLSKEEAFLSGCPFCGALSGKPCRKFVRGGKIGTIASNHVVEERAATHKARLRESRLLKAHMGRFDREIVWAAGSPTVVQAPWVPDRIWTMMHESDPNKKPEVPARLMHGHNVLAEDFVHDWNNLPNLKIRYYSRHVGKNDGVWLLLERTKSK